MAKIDNPEAKWACAILAFVLVVGTALAQYTPPSGGGSGTNYWTASGNDIYNNNTGSVGIGGAPGNLGFASGTFPVGSQSIAGTLRVFLDRNNIPGHGAIYLSNASNDPYIGWGALADSWFFADSRQTWWRLNTEIIGNMQSLLVMPPSGGWCWPDSGDGSNIPALCMTRDSTGVVQINTATRDSLASLKASNLSGISYSTSTVCASAATPAACGSSAAGSVAIPTGVTTVTLVVDTTAVTASSQIILTPDDSITIPMTTCNSTLATLVGGMAVTARTAGTSFTITYNGTIAANPLCVSYQIIN